MLSLDYRYFYQAATDLSIRQASNNLNINSSAIVRQIQKLEDKLNTKLFLRNSKGLQLTHEGKLIFDHLSLQIKQNNTFLDKLKSNQSKQLGTIKISTVETLAVHFLASIIVKFRLKYPDICIQVISKKPGSILDDLISKRTDFGISFTKEIPRSLKILFHQNFPIGIMCSPQHILANKEEILLNDCLKFPLLFHPGTTFFWTKIQRELGIPASDLNPQLVANSFAFIKNYLMEDNSYISFFTKLGAIKEIHNKQLIYRNVKHKLFLNNKIGIIIAKNIKLNRYTEFFIKLIQDDLETYRQ